MVHNNALHSYQKVQVYDEIDPNKLILLLYEGAIKRLKLSVEGVKNKNPKMRGENLGKAIAIISELNASLDDNIKTEEILFLKGLYQSMLVELPKVNVSNDIKTLQRAIRYIAELKNIWEKTVMHHPQKEKNNDVKTPQNNLYGNNGTTGENRSFAV